MENKPQTISEIIKAVDEVLSNSHCNVLDALNAVSIMSAHLAHNLGVSRADFIYNLENMYDQTRPQGEPTVVEENENE
jgi:hypothetical protein